MRPIVVTPTRREADAFRGRAVVCASGSAAGDLIADSQWTQRFDMLLIVGICGGLDPSLAPGSVILARSVETTASDELLPDPRILGAAQRALRARHAPFVSSRLLTIDHPAASRDEKRELWNTHGAGGVDMETHELAAVAAQRDIPWLAIRAVLDPSASQLPVPLLAWRRESDEKAIFRAIRYRPWEWPALARLGWQMRTACRALGAALDVVIPALEDLAPDRVRSMLLEDVSIPLVASNSPR